MDTASAVDNPSAANPIHDAAPAAEATTASKLGALPALVRARVIELQARVRDLQARAQQLPSEARTRALALVTRVRVALDLPSRSEIAELTQRLDALDQRIAHMAIHQVEAAVPVATLPAATIEPAAAVEPVATASIDVDAIARAATVPASTVEPVTPEAEPAIEAAPDAAPAEAAPAAEAASPSVPERNRKDKRRHNAAKTSRR